MSEYESKDGTAVNCATYLIQYWKDQTEKADAEIKRLKSTNTALHTLKEVYCRLHSQMEGREFLKDLVRYIDQQYYSNREDWKEW